DPRYLAAHGLAPGRLCGVVGLAGPYAFDPLAYRSTRAVFAGLDDPDEARPVKRIAAPGVPPFLLLHGADDGTVKPFNTTGFAAALRSAGAAAETELVPEIGHIRILLALARPLESLAPVGAPIARFVDSRDCR
ncbi:MAG: prolyl oligopeptidase family serine peptidase, partial [Alphaproteobacteria bacterium]